MKTPIDFLYSLLSRIISSGRVPQHIGFIMDGHRRYGRSKGMKAEAGYHFGTDVTIEVSTWCYELGVKEITLFGFSIDNFGRPENEVRTVMEETQRALRKLSQDPRTEGVKVNLMSDYDSMPQYMRADWAEIVFHKAVLEKGTCNIAFVYTSHEELTTAARMTAEGVAAGSLRPEDICQDLLNNCLYSQGCQPVDMIVRTSGEVRLSDFLLWQASDACLYFTNPMWPEFSRWELLKSMMYYQRWVAEQDLVRGAEKKHSDQVPAQSTLRTQAFARDLCRQRFYHITGQELPVQVPAQSRLRTQAFARDLGRVVGNPSYSGGRVVAAAQAQCVARVGCRSYCTPAGCEVIAWTSEDTQVRQK